MAAIAARHDEYLGFGGRVFALTTDGPHQNSWVMKQLALPFPILSDPSRDRAITPVGFADENDPRQISRPGTIILAPGGEEVWRHAGRDYADRPHEDQVLAALSDLDLEPTTQEVPALGHAEKGGKSTSLEALMPYMRGAKFAALALRSRHRHVSDEFKDDAKEYVARTERYMEALSAVGDRRA